ncbi:hypothetical protein LCGC14_2118740, partial [marine sediment metagenome]
LMQGAMMGWKKDFPRAAQLQDDPEAWARWQDIVYSVGKQMPDRRTEAQILVAGFRAIPLTDLTENNPDWDTFFTRREEYVDKMTPVQLKEFEAERASTRTQVGKMKDADFDTMEPFLAVGRDLAKLFKLEDGFSDYLASQDKQGFLNNNETIRNLLSAGEQAREAMRQGQLPNVDPVALERALWRWEFIDSPLNVVVAAEVELNRQTQGGEIKNRITAPTIESTLGIPPLTGR